MGGSKTQTIGYAYFMGLHMGISKGPVNALLAIRAGGRDIFTGQRYTAPAGVDAGHFPNPYNSPDRTRAGWNPTGPVGPVTANERLYLFAPDVFGGKDREGGIMGALDVMFGARDQAPNDYLASVTGQPQPGYRGTFTAVFRGGMVGAMNPYLKAWEWRVRRTTAGWQGDPWYPERCEIDVGSGVLCMNPAHIIYQVLTDTEDGMGYPPATLDEATFRDAADLFHMEGLGLFLKWMRSDKIEAFVQQVLDHCNAVLVQNPTTALFELIPLRDDYVDSELLTLTPDDASLEMFERATLEETVNEVTVKWDDTHTGEEGSVTVQELANIQAMGGVVNQAKTYAGCPTEGIAKRLAQRDLDIGSALLARVRIRANRKAYGVVPGRCIALEGFTKLGLGRVIVRPLRVNYGGSGERGIIIEGAEDVFGLPTNTYVGSQPEGWTPPNTTPMPAPNVEAFEAPYRDLVQMLGSSGMGALSPASGFLAFAAQHPGGVPINYRLVTRQGSGAFAEVGHGDFTPTAVLATPVSKTDTILPLVNLSRWGQVTPGTVLFIGSHPDAEAVRIDSMTGTTATVARGALDTVPKVWPSGARVWAYDEYAAADPTEYATGEAVEARALTVTSTGALAQDGAPGDSVTMASRQARPYPPARLRVNGEAWPASSGARLALTWNHRDRVLQADQVLGTDDASMGPEPGTTYRVRVYQQPDTLLHEQTGITGNSYTWDAVQATDMAMRVEVSAQRDGLDSWQAQVHALAVESGDKVTNGTFGSDTAWTKGAGWTIGSGRATKAAGSAAAIGQAVAVTPGASYRVEYAVVGWVAGTVRARLVGSTTAQAPTRNADGTYTETLTAPAGSSTLELYADAAFVGSVDNVKLHRLT